MSSDKDSPDATPVWCTGSDPIEVELVTSGKTYSVDTDIAKRMGIPQEGRETESPFKLADCTDHDFERALVFCAQDRACSDPPSTELAHIIQTLSVVSTEPTSEPTPDTLSTTFANINLTEDDEDESYVPSESESSSESDEEYSDTDIGTANIQAESEEYQARQKEKEKEKEKEKDKEKEQPGV